MDTLALAIALLEEWLLVTPENRGSNPEIGNY